MVTEKLCSLNARKSGWPSPRELDKKTLTSYKLTKTAYEYNLSGTSTNTIPKQVPASILIKKLTLDNTKVHS